MLSALFKTWLILVYFYKNEIVSHLWLRHLRYQDQYAKINHNILRLRGGNVIGPSKVKE